MKNGWQMTRRSEGSTCKCLMYGYDKKGLFHLTWAMDHEMIWLFVDDGHSSNLARNGDLGRACCCLAGWF